MAVTRSNPTELYLPLAFHAARLAVPFSPGFS
jgi:hypothetical protein